MTTLAPLTTSFRRLKGWAQVRSGRIETGLELMESNLAAIRESGFQRLGFQLHVLADAKRAAGDDGQALEAIAEAFEICATTGERLWLPELHRIKGEILLDGKDNSIEAAERELDQALTISHEQGAMLFELRAAKSLARLRLKQGRQADARDVLGPLYDRFTEGRDTPDLVEAKALLDEFD